VTPLGVERAMETIVEFTKPLPLTLGFAQRRSVAASALRRQESVCTFLLSHRATTEESDLFVEKTLDKEVVW
jgi:hypothetical protein